MTREKYITNYRENKLKVYQNVEAPDAPFRLFTVYPRLKYFALNKSSRAAAWL